MRNDMFATASKGVQMGGRLSQAQDRGNSPRKQAGLWISLSTVETCIVSEVHIHGGVDMNLFHAGFAFTSNA